MAKEDNTKSPRASGATIKELGDQLVSMVQANLHASGREIAEDVAGAADYAAARMQHLAGCVGDPGFEEACAAEAQSVAMKAAGRAMRRADSVDQRVLAIAQGALGIGAKAIATLIPA